MPRGPRQLPAGKCRNERFLCTCPPLLYSSTPRMLLVSVGHFDQDPQNVAARWTVGALLSKRCELTAQCGFAPPVSRAAQAHRTTVCLVLRGCRSATAAETQVFPPSIRATRSPPRAARLAVGRGRARRLASASGRPISRRGVLKRAASKMPALPPTPHTDPSINTEAGVAPPPHFAVFQALQIDVALVLY